MGVADVSAKGVDLSWPKTGTSRGHQRRLRPAITGSLFIATDAPRAAATEHRVAALAPYDGLYSFADVLYRKDGPEIMEHVTDGFDTSDTRVNALVRIRSAPKPRSDRSWDRACGSSEQTAPRLSCAPLAPLKVKHR
jgi:hypothetical protein